MILSYLIWNGDPEIFSIGSFALRWYGLLFALGFLVSQQILYYIFKKEGKPEVDVDTLTIYMVVATVLGARLGHVIFYQPEMIWQTPLQIFLPFEFSPFRFTGLQGLASHGGAFGILLALWLYSRKKKPGQNYLQTLDRIVIVVAITGAMIRLGNFFNSEIIGKPTNAVTAVVFINPLLGQIEGEDNNSPVLSVDVRKDDARPWLANGRVPLNLFVFFKKGTTQDQAKGYVDGTFRRYLHQHEVEDFVDDMGARLDYELSYDEATENFGARIHLLGISRHPAQLYESISCVALFLFLFWIWTRQKVNTPEGRIFGWFMVILWSLRFAYEFLKKNQVSFEDGMQYNMGQILSIPLVIVGIWILIRSYRSRPEEKEGDLNIRENKNTL